MQLSQCDLRLPIDEDKGDAPDLYVGMKPPISRLPESVLPDHFATHQCISLDRARELDFKFLHDE